MHIADKLDILTGEARYDLACACGPSQPRVRGSLGRWIYPAVLPGGKRANLLKILLSNACMRSCAYCAQRRGRNFARTDFMPDELAAAFMDMYRKGQVTGLFLSSAINGRVEETMERMIKTVEILRAWHGYQGWVHLKILPGASREKVERAASLANRLSLNLEAPTPQRLKAISPQKKFLTDIYERMGWVQSLVDAKAGRCRGQTTQFVVGAGEETDSEFVLLMGKLYSEMKLSRIYFSAFQPVVGTPLEGRPPAPFEREHRLYQADFLLRKYGFGADELVLDEEGNLPRGKDPKTVWAESHPEVFPIEVNTATRSQLLRIPGVGPVSAGKIVKSRRIARLTTLDDLKRTGAIVRWAEPYVLLCGRRPNQVRGAQLRLRTGG